MGLVSQLYIHLNHQRLLKRTILAGDTNQRSVSSNHCPIVSLVFQTASSTITLVHLVTDLSYCLESFWFIYFCRFCLIGTKCFSIFHTSFTSLRLNYWKVLLCSATDGSSVPECCEYSVRAEHNDVKVDKGRKYVYPFWFQCQRRYCLVHPALHTYICSPITEKKKYEVSSSLVSGNSVFNSVYRSRLLMTCKI